MRLLFTWCYMSFGVLLMLCLIIRLSYMPDEFMSFTYIQSYFVNVTIMLVDSDVLLNTFLYVSYFLKRVKLKFVIFLWKEPRTLSESLEYVSKEINYVKSWCLYSNLFCVITFADCCDKVYGQFQQKRNTEFTTPLFNYYAPLYLSWLCCSKYKRRIKSYDIWSTHRGVDKKN